MKKTYIIPETLVVDIRFNHSLLAGSPTDTHEQVSEQPELGRFFSFDEDDDEEY